MIAKPQATPSVDQPPVESLAGDSPCDAAVPFWVTACVRLQPPQRKNGSTVDSAADKVLTAVQVLMADRLKAVGDAAVVLDRTKISRWCGYDSPKKAGWIFDYLVLIGFLVIEQQYIQGRRGRGADTFTVFAQPPAGFVGPRTYAELDRALADPTFPRSLFVAAPKTRRSGSWFPGGHQDPDLGSQVGAKTTKPAGQGLDSRLGTKTTDLGSQVGTKTTKPAGQHLGSHLGTFSQIDRRSSISEGEIEDRSIEPVPGRSAQPPATGQDEALAGEVRELVRQLPWEEWARLREVKFRLTTADADLVQEAVCEAVTSGGITLEMALEIGQAAVSEAKTAPAKYVIDAFSKHLRRWVRRLAVEPMAAEPLPLLASAAPLPRRRGPGAPAAAASAAVTAGPQDAPPAVPEWLPECLTCDAREGERFPSARTITGEDGRERRCPDCLPPVA